MSNTTLFRNGTVFSSGQCRQADVLAGGGVIREVAPRIERAASRVVDLTGLVLSPGFVDLHAHLREPGFSHKETIRTGTQAAAAGGFTTVCAMPNLNPTPDSIAHLAQAMDLIRRDAVVEVLPYGTLTIGEAGKALSDIDALAAECAGFSDDGRGVQSAEIMEAAMRRVAARDSLLCAHCEDEGLLAPGGCVHDGAVATRFGAPGISSASEWKQLERDLALVRRTGVRYHMCHISTSESVALLKQAKAEGLPVTGECTPHQLMLCQDDITADDGRFKMNPPLRTAADREAIISGLLEGVIDCIATDHAPHTIEEKAKGLAGSAFGVVGLETAFAVCHTALVKTGRCSLAFLLSRLTSAPAGILRRRAEIVPGAPANLTVLDPAAQWTVNPTAFLSRGRSTPFTGRTLTGRVVSTWRQGTPIFGKGVTP